MFLLSLILLFHHPRSILCLLAKPFPRPIARSGTKYYPRLVALPFCSLVFQLSQMHDRTDNFAAFVLVRAGWSTQETDGVLPQHLLATVSGNDAHKQLTNATSE